MSDTTNVATSNPPTLGLSSVTHPTGATSVAVIAGVVGQIASNPPSTWYGWALAAMTGGLAAYGAFAPKASAR